MASLMDRYSTEEFEKIVKESFSYKECLKNLGYVSNSGDATRRLKNKIEQLNIDISHFTSTMPIQRCEQNIFIENSTACQKVLRNWYKKGNYTSYICSICGQEPIWQDKELVLILDHINGINNDDRLSNLRWVCPNCNQQLDTTNGKNKHRAANPVNYCVDCGIPISKNAVRCIDCYNKGRTSEMVSQVTRNELKQLIRTTPFTKIGEKFKVSDNAIRRWCKKYNLPSKIREIKQYSDQEWEKL